MVKCHGGMESLGKCPTIARGGWALLELTDDTRYFTLSYFLHNRGMNSIGIFRLQIDENPIFGQV